MADGVAWLVTWCGVAGVASCGVAGGVVVWRGWWCSGVAVGVVWLEAWLCDVGVRDTAQGKVVDMYQE